MQGLDFRARTILAGVREDFQSGATQLALNTLDELLSYLDDTKPGVEALYRLLAELRAARPSMIVIGNALGMIEQRLASDPHAARQAVLDTRDQLQNATTSISRHAREHLPKAPVIMTHSASSVVLALFRSMAENQQSFSVICTQSSPGFEGHSLARALDNLSVPVTLITDAQMGLFISGADVVITGCDTWLDDGYFINKSGTLLLALAAKAANKPFWVLADSFRQSDADSASVELEEMPVNELNAPEGEWITPRNVYFELVPHSLVSQRISEQGVFSCPAGPRR
ncbi:MULTISPECIES: translation initiation factor eIF-2B [unclassified Marinobacter]|jgi:translation initiation factor 2B subunit (eIF-2B alpha/beta/delta family)|uniref:translation initiation factor eIF-2B n=1 Tax=unclassified Marinobacter TaxID=83889 RepID=UPI001927D96A|nr:MULTISPECIES: initiation factor 2B [unclassified Marinobacter]MBL3823650.1 initiation factor 2B [Marinobacter sp. MC3]MBL3891806.1 initiation factor 2B [Marinobacter sp. MW3]